MAIMELMAIMAIMSIINFNLNLRLRRINYFMVLIIIIKT